MNSHFQYKSREVRIERRCDEAGKHMITVFIDNVRFPYAWKLLKPLTPVAYAKATIDAMPEGEPMCSPATVPEPAEKIWHFPR